MKTLLSRSPLAPAVFAAGLAMSLGLGLGLGSVAHAQTSLADTPPDVSQGIPGNLLLALSVEYPTALNTANNANYSSSTSYVGYFDPAKCYTYQFDPLGTSTDYFANDSVDIGTSTSPGTGLTVGAGNHFIPAGAASATHTCSGTTIGGWSGNFLNWVMMQTIDPFRWALTGGYRVIDLPGYTVLEKAWNSGQGGNQEPLNKTLTGSVNTVTPFNWSSITMRLWGLGNRMQFTGTGSIDGNNGSTAEIPYGLAGYYSAPANLVYGVKTRVAVCVAGSLETNCTGYPLNSTAPTTWKPEGLIQKYASSIRFGVMGYLNDWNVYRDAGVLRAQMEFVGPTYPVPGQSTGLTNTNAEWSSTDGTFFSNPDATDAANTKCSLAPGQVCTTTTGAPLQSGVVNYLNKFGEAAQNYKQYDPVSELYYAAYRYFKYQIVSSSGAVTALGNVPEWSTLTTASSLAQQEQWVDGFPVITNWADPIQYACQPNFILGIGDANAWDNGNVPTGSSSLPPQDNSSNEPTKPTGVVADNTIDAVKATNALGVLEGLGSNLGDTNVSWCCGDDTYFMSGLAFYAHTTDLRPNDPKFATTSNTYQAGTNYPGSKIAIQTIQTYWLDVQEAQTYHYQNQFWLAAKYGGFSIPSSSLVPPTYGFPTTSIPISQWASGANLPLKAYAPSGYTGNYGIGDSTQGGSSGAGKGYAMPNNYFGAGNAASMVAGLTSAFASIASQTKEITNPFGSASPNLVSGGGSTTYASNYDASTWAGDVDAYNTSFDSNNNITSTLLWSLEGITAASTTPSAPNEILNLQLASYVSGGTTYQGWDTKRNVVTWNGTQGVPFRYANLTGTQQTALATVVGSNTTIATNSTATQRATNYLNYLRGDRSNEGVGATSAGFRVRNAATVLGDIIDSQLTVVGAPNSPYVDAYNPLYQEFAKANANRTPVIYVGANDGMVHAFNGSATAATSVNSAASPAGGSELFAYIPSALYQGPTWDTGAVTAALTANPTLPLSSQVPATFGLAELGAQPFAHHMLVDATPEAFDVDLSYTGANHPAAGSGNWHTLLIGGLGKGGRGYYAIDITNPGSFTSESAVSTNVLWEFTDSTMGYSFGDPNVVKTAKYGWVVIFTSGYNTPDGHGYIYVVNPANGALLEKVTTASLDGGTYTNQVGLTYASAFVASFGDNTADSLYAGDLLGNVWRFSLTAAQGSSTPIAVTQFAHLVGPDGYVQPITTRPLIEVDPSTSTTRYVLVGTGQFLSSSDILSTHIQSFYSIRDGTVAAFATPTTLPNGVTFPITRANLVSDTTALLLAKGITGTAAQPEGWYLDLPAALSGAGSPRINVQPQPDNGIVVFAANIPNGDVCYPSGSNAVYALDIAAGVTELGTTLVPITSETVPGGMVSVISVVGTTSSTGKNPGSPFFVVGTKTGSPESITPKAGTVGSVKTLNYREVPTAD